MKKGGGKQKGAAFERAVCKQISWWLTNGQRDDVLWRSAMSGGRATVHAKKGKKIAHVAGDICAVHPSGERFCRDYFVECKFYANLSLASFVFAGVGPLEVFWNRACVEADAYNKHPLLIAKENARPPLVLLHRVGAAWLQDTYRVSLSSQVWIRDTNRRVSGDVVILPYSEVFRVGNRGKLSRPKLRRG